MFFDKKTNLLKIKFSNYGTIIPYYIIKRRIINFMKKRIITLIILLSLNLFGKEEERQIRKAFDVEGNQYIIRPLYGMGTPSSLGELLSKGDKGRSQPW